MAYKANVEKKDLIDDLVLVELEHLKQKQLDNEELTTPDRIFLGKVYQIEKMDKKVEEKTSALDELLKELPDDRLAELYKAIAGLPTAGTDNEDK